MLKLVPRNRPGNRSESRPPVRRNPTTAPPESRRTFLRKRPPAHRNPAFWNRQPPSPIPGAPANGFFGNSGKAEIGWGSEGTRLTGEDSAFRYDLERSDKVTVSKLLIPAIPAIADATGKSGIPVAQRANSATGIRSIPAETSPGFRSRNRSGIRQFRFPESWARHGRFREFRVRNSARRNLQFRNRNRPA